MQKVMKQSRALFIMLAFLLVIAPMSTLADAGKKETVNYVALGDSLAKGTLNNGEPSEGYIGNIVNDLETSGYEVNLTNEGENGYTTADVLYGLSDVTKDWATADIITISVGANDVLGPLMVLGPSLLDVFDPKYLDRDEREKWLEEVEIAEKEMENAAKNKLDSNIVDGAKGAVEEIEEELEEQSEVFDKYKDTPLIGTLLLQLLNNIDSAIESVKTANDSYGNAQDLFSEDVREALVALEKSGSELEVAWETFGDVSDDFDNFDELGFDLPDDLEDAAVSVLGEIALAEPEIKAALDAIQVDEDNVSAIGAVKLFIEAQEVADKASLLAGGLDDIEDAIQNVGINMVKILGALKKVNPDAEIYVMGYYNAIPYLDKELATPLLGGLNGAIQKAIQTSNDLSETEATFVPTAHLFEENKYLPNKYDIHPNEDGYKAIAEAFMGEISKSFPNITDPEVPGEKEIDLEKKIGVSAGEQLYINGTNVSLLLPEDLPAGTTLTVRATSEEALANAEGLESVGDALNFAFQFPDGYEDYEGTFKLVMGYDTDSADDVGIYHYNEEKGIWESQKGEVDKEAQEISLDVSHFSSYGVFAKTDDDDGKDPDKTDPNDDGEGKDPGKTDPNGDTGDNGDKTDGTETPADSSDDNGTTDDSDGKVLPETATNNYNWLIIGSLLFVAGLTTLFFFKRKRRLINSEA